MSLNIHFHILFLDDVYVTTSDRLTFRRVPPPTVAALEKLIRGISERVGQALDRQGLLVRDLESSFLRVNSAEGSGVDDLLGHSITELRSARALLLEDVPLFDRALDAIVERLKSTVGGDGEAAAEPSPA